MRSVVIVGLALISCTGLTIPPSLEFSCQRDDDCLPGFRCEYDGVCRTDPRDGSVVPRVLSFRPESGPIGTVITVRGQALERLTDARIGEQRALIVSTSPSAAELLVMPGTQRGRLTLTLGELVLSPSPPFTPSATPVPLRSAPVAVAPTDATGGSSSGISVSLSADGLTALVGGHTDAALRGAAWVFSLAGDGGYRQQGAKLNGVDLDPMAAEQGRSVALSASGTTSLVGAIYEQPSGAARIFMRRADGTWSQEGPKLVGADASTGTSLQGMAVALSGDGKTALVGGPADNFRTGASWVFTLGADGGWQQQGPKLVGLGGAAGASQGSAVALSADGTTAAIGGPGDASGVGAVWVFARSGEIWAQQGPKLVGQVDGGVGAFGLAVALTLDGDTLAVRGPGDDAAGAVWFFERVDGRWSQRGQKLAGTGISFGGALAMNGDGTLLLVTRNASSGAAALFLREGENWSLAGTLGANAPTAASVALSSNGRSALFGTPGNGSAVGVSWLSWVSDPLP